MASTQEIRRRIKSIKNTRQITKAMEMVAASKMKRAQDSTVQSRAYAQEALKLLKNLSQKTEEAIHPLLQEREIKKILVVMVSSDKGMCGGYNGQVIRTATNFIKENEGKSIDWVTIGKRGEQMLRKLDQNIVASFSNFPTYPSSSDISPISKVGLDGFCNDTYDQVVVIFTNFVSTLKQVPQAKTLLPMSVIKATQMLEEQVKDDGSYCEFEPDQGEVLDYVLPRLSEMQIFHAVLEAIASEQSARMMAMKSASDNAGDMIDDLTLTYNSMRQASITQELAEVSAGSEAIK